MSLSCDNTLTGYQCNTNISHYWGQYSPYFTETGTGLGTAAAIPDTLPATCNISFVQVLSRHGARFPTAAKSVTYAATIAKVKAATSFNGSYAFLKTYTYDLSSDNLTTFGQQEMVNSGIKFFDRYQNLSAGFTPFIRAGDEFRVTQSAQNFSQGYHLAKASYPKAKSADPYPYPILAISEATGSNNTLNHGLCTKFESGIDSAIGTGAQAKFAAIFIPAIQARLNANLPNANLTSADTINLMDMCPYEVANSVNGAYSAFCSLFQVSEWQSYGYYQTLGKWYVACNFQT